jgi:uracil-DNA glycosylase
MSQPIPVVILDAIDAAHSSWRPALLAGLEALAQADANYLPALATDVYMPTEGRLFAAFAQPLDAVRYVLVGEGPYPRVASATGFCFMDGAVGDLWSQEPAGGLSKQVNRATSLRNFMKMLLVADGQLSVQHTTGDAMAQIALKARASSSPLIQSLSELQNNLSQQGFLLLNAALVFRSHVPPVKEAKAWLPFLQVVLGTLAQHAEQHGKTPATLVLWGKIAEQINAYSVAASFPKAVSEHPYNLSFIGNVAMQALFGPMHLLQKAA